MDNLEEQIMKNRGELDKYNPSSDIWERINKRLKKQKPPVKLWFSIVAMIIVILGSAVVLLKQGYKQSDANNEFINNKGLTSATPQLKETEIYYNTLINSLYTEATPLLTKNPEIRKELNTDLLQLDSISSDLKKDLKDNISNQDVVEALIQNYRIKIRILEDMLSILKENENNPEKKKSYEL